MADDNQKKIFSKNLNRYIYESGKTQKEIADTIKVSPQTFNTWCKGVAIPRMGKIQLLADYFSINKTDLIDEPSPSSLTEKDKRDIAKDLDRMMDMLDSGEDGPIRYNGEEIDDESRVLLRNALELGLTQLKKENKRLYDPTKNKKDK